MILVRLERVVGRGEAAAVELAGVPREGDIVEVADGRLFRVRDVRWVAGDSCGDEWARLGVQEVCAGCHRAVPDGAERCARCAAGGTDA